ncbi:hypothetical protein QZM76_24715, partial [Burkholderia multivorans]|nr:hypothetical protein [Burkholderia multivorans]
MKIPMSIVIQARHFDRLRTFSKCYEPVSRLGQAESIIKCNTPDLPCTRPCRRPMGTRYQHLSAEERATIMIML